MELSRSKFEQLTDSLFERTNGPVEDCLKEAEVPKEDIDELVLVGGMTRMPKVVDTARKLIGKEPHRGVNPDEVVAVGAAIQGGVLRGDVKDVLLLDVTPLTLSIETMGGIATPMIERNTTIPAKKSQIFSTAADNQPSVDIVVCQGERKMISDNKVLGNFRLDGIPPAPRGTPQIEVTFDIDANGILHVSAVDKGSGKEQKISIEGSSGLDDKEIEKAKREAEEFAEQDRKRFESVELKNKADNLVYQVKKQLDELGDKLSGDQKKPVEDAVAKVEEAMKSDDPDEIKQATGELEKTFGEIAAAAQAAGGADPASTGSGPAPASGEAGSDEPKQAKGKVVDADFEVVDEEQK